MLLTMLACSKAESPDDDMYAVIEGCVTDPSGSPIEHIEVTLEFSKKLKAKTLYTSSNGFFIVGISSTEARRIDSITITLTDLDGEENGGSFSTQKEIILLHEYQEEKQEGPVLLQLDFTMKPVE